MGVFDFVKDSYNWAMGNVDANYAEQLATGSSDVKIQGNYRGKILEGAFRKKGNLVTVETGGITAIENEAFQGCEKLVKVKLMEVSSIGEKVFSGCNKLEEIEIENNCISVDAVREALKNSEIKKQIQIIITNEKTEYLYESVTRFIANGLSYGTDDLKIPDFYVDEIEKEAFANKDLTNIDTNNIKLIGDNAFDGCKMLKSIKMPNVLTIGIEAFKGCDNLEKIDIGGASVSIPDVMEALENSKIKKQVVIKKDAIRQVFVGVYEEELENVRQGDAAEKHEVEKGDLGGSEPEEQVNMEESSAEDCAVNADKARELIQELGVELEIPNGYNSIEEKAFEGTEVVKLNTSGVVDINNEAFLNCMELTEITFGRFLSQIGDNVFKGCRNLRRIYVNTLDQIELLKNSILDLEKTESRNEMISRDDITGDVIEVYFDGEKVGLDMVLKLRQPDLNCVYYEFLPSVSEIDHQKINIIPIRARNIKAVGVKTIPGARALKRLKHLRCLELNKTVCIEPSAFKDFNELVKVVAAGDESFDEITIEEHAFENSGIVSIKAKHAPNGIGEEAFCNCRALREIEIPKMEGKVFSRAFANCKSLERVILNTEGAKEDLEVDLSAFENCNDNVHIEGNYTLKIRVTSLDAEYVKKYKVMIESQISDGNLEIDDVGTICKDAFSEFQDFEGLKSITVKEVDLIEEGAFRGVKSLEAVTACSNVEVEGFAFENCESLKYVCEKEGFDCNLSYNIGESAFEGTAIASLRVSEIAKIEKKAFYNCRNLEKIEIKAEEILIGEEAFANCQALSNLKIIISDIQNLKIDKSAFNGCDNLKMLSIGNQNYGSMEEFFNKS